MKNLLVVLSFLVLGCNGFGQQNNTASTDTKAKILVYFFHGTHRCAGCINAEKAAVEALNALYKDQIDKGIIKFESINVEEEKNKALAEKYEAAWNKLLFVKNDNSKQQVELTEQAFAYSNDHIEMCKIVKETVDKLLK